MVSSQPLGWMSEIPPVKKRLSLCAATPVAIAHKHVTTSSFCIIFIIIFVIYSLIIVTKVIIFFHFSSLFKNILSDDEVTATRWTKPPSIRHITINGTVSTSTDSPICDTTPCCESTCLPWHVILFPKCEFCLDRYRVPSSWDGREGVCHQACTSRYCSARSDC